MENEDLPPDGEEAGTIDAPVENVATTEENTNAQDAPPTVEDLASEMGWRPQDQWRGDPDKWKPAHEFMRSTVDVNHKLNNRLKTFEDQLSTMARTSAHLTERAVAQERQRLLDERQKAFEEGDAEAFNRVDKQLSELKAPEPVNTPAPEVQEFMGRNTWFGQDRDATAWAHNRAGELAKQGISAARQLAIVEREAKNLFPELFPDEQPKPKPKAAHLNAPGSRGGKVATKGFAALPADAQAAALDYEKRGICSKDEYAKIYFDEQEA